jgi:hypothetical protein
MSAELQRIGIEELAIFWNNLPPESHVEIFLPSINVDWVTLLRDWRRGPSTYHPTDASTLVLKPEPKGVTFLPFPPVGLDRIAGLITIELPSGIRAGQVFNVDVLQLRPAIGLSVGAFRLTVAVRKAVDIFEREARLLETFAGRLAATPVGNRWRPVLARQLEYFQARVRALTTEAVEECRTHDDPNKRVRVVLDRIKVLDTDGPLVQGRGQVSLTARVASAANGGIEVVTRLPTTGGIPVGANGAVIEIGKEIFRGIAEGELEVEVWGGDKPDAHCHYRRTIKPGTAFRPSDEPRDPENVGDWQLWYHVEPA